MKKKYDEAAKGLEVFRQRVESNKNGDESIVSKLRQAERVKKELKELKMRLKERSQMSRSIDRKYALYRSRYILRTGEVPSMDIMEKSYADVQFLKEGNGYVGESVNEGVNEGMDESVDESVDEHMDEHMNEHMDEHMNEHMDEHMDDYPDHDTDHNTDHYPDDYPDDYANDQEDYPDDTPYDTSYDTSFAFTVDFLPRPASSPSLDFEVVPPTPPHPKDFHRCLTKARIHFADSKPITLEDYLQLPLRYDAHFLEVPRNTTVSDVTPSHISQLGHQLRDHQPRRSLRCAMALFLRLPAPLLALFSHRILT